jgi:ribosomal protein S18 acetylase RimI-like enzyme
MTVPDQNSDIRIELIRRKQMPQAAGVLSAAFNTAAGPVRRDILNSLAARSPIDTFVALVGGEVVGVVRCKSYPAQPGEPLRFCIFDLAVKRAFRQHGVGHALMSYVEDHTAQKLAPGQPAAIYLGDRTKASNPSSAFYEKMGYEPVPEFSADEDGAPILKKSITGKTRQRTAAPAPAN